jgi:hypothetical protein
MCRSLQMWHLNCHGFRAMGWNSWKWNWIFRRRVVKVKVMFATAGNFVDALNFCLFPLETSTYTRGMKSLPVSINFHQIDLMHTHVPSRSQTPVNLPKNYHSHLSFPLSKQPRLKSINYFFYSILHPRRVCVWWRKSTATNAIKMRWLPKCNWVGNKFLPVPTFSLTLFSFKVFRFGQKWTKNFNVTDQCV